MGKGTIISGGTDGQYQLQINYDRTQYDRRIAALDASIAALETKLVDLDPDSSEYKLTNLQITALEKNKESMEGAMPEDKTISAWCSDLTEDLAGEVGTIEVPGESVEFNVQPGYEGNAVYNSGRDGQLSPTVSQSAAQAFYNLAILPGWQKWKPTYRYGVISNLSGDACTVTLEAATSSQQGLSVNQGTTLSGVQIEYMTCNGAAFSDGDTALVMFSNQDWSTPKVIGFKSSPKSCLADVYLRVTIDGRTLVNCGQKIFIDFTNTEGVNVSTSTRNSEPGDDIKRYGFFGPYDLSSWDQSTDIDVCLKREKVYYDGAGYLMFDYHKESVNGDLALWGIYKRYDHTTNEMDIYGEDGSKVAEADFSDIKIYKYAEVIDSANEYAEETIWTFKEQPELVKDYWQKTIKLASGFEQVDFIPFSISAENFIESIVIEDEIYNTVTDSTDSNASVFIGNLEYGLKGSRVQEYDLVSAGYFDEIFSYDVLPVGTDDTPVLSSGADNYFPPITHVYLDDSGHSWASHYFRGERVQTQVPWELKYRSCAIFDSGFNSLCYIDSSSYAHLFPCSTIDPDTLVTPAHIVFIDSDYKAIPPGGSTVENIMSFGSIRQYWEDSAGSLTYFNTESHPDERYTWSATLIDLPTNYF